MYFNQNSTSSKVISFNKKKTSIFGTWKANVNVNQTLEKKDVRFYENQI